MKKQPIIAWLFGTDIRRVSFFFLFIFNRSLILIANKSHDYRYSKSMCWCDELSLSHMKFIVVIIIIIINVQSGLSIAKDTYIYMYTSNAQEKGWTIEWKTQTINSMNNKPFSMKLNEMENIGIGSSWTHDDNMCNNNTINIFICIWYTLTYRYCMSVEISNKIRFEFGKGQFHRIAIIINRPTTTNRKKTATKNS